MASLHRATEYTHTHTMSSITTSSPVAARTQLRRPRQEPQDDTSGSARKESMSGFLKNLYNTYKGSRSLKESQGGSEDGPEIKRARGDSGAGAGADSSAAPILLYEPQEGETRPPVLPILPVQRLRLLRHKQQLRQREQFRELEEIEGSARGMPMAVALLQSSEELAHDANSTVVYHKSATPSPIKNMPPGSSARAVSPGPGTSLVVSTQGARASLPSGLRSLQGRRAARKENKNLGTQWSAAFEYDAAEDEDEKASSDVVVPLSETDKTVVSVAVPAQPLLSKKRLPGDALTATQRDLLQNGPQKPQTPIIAVPSAAKKTIGLSSAVASAKKGSTVLMPTVGFDFIKNSDTPTKTSPVSLTKSMGVKIDTEKKKAAPLFSLGGADTEKKQDARKLPKLSFNLPKTTAPPATKGFSFGDAITKPSRGNDEDTDDLPRKKKRAQPDVAVDLTSGTDKPVFSFGGKPESAATTPAFSFGAKSDSSAATKPAFSLGATSAKKDDATKPPFSLGAAPDKKDDATKPSFSFGAKPQEEEKSKAAPSFSFGAAVETSKNDAPAKPSFSFGLPKGDKPGLDKPVLPKLGELPGSSKENSTTPSFSFTPKPIAESAPAAAAPSATSAPKFSFGSKPAESTEVPKPAFTFGGSAPVSSKESTAAPADTPKPSFSFSKPPEATHAGAASTSAGNLTTQPNNTTPSFTFGASNSATPAGSVNPSSVFGGNAPAKPADVFGAGQSSQPANAASGAASGGFSFKRAPATLGQESSVTPSAPSFNFGQANNSNSNPQGNNNSSGFSFGNNVPQSNPTSTGSGFGGNANPAPMNGFGNNNPQNNTGGSVFQSGGVGGSSFNFGGQNQPSNGMMAQGAQMQQQQPAFNPSTTANFNFGGNNSVNPASIFNSAGPAMPPQQMFSAPPNAGMAGNTMNGGNPVNSVIPGRKLARMRGQRR